MSILVTRPFGIGNAAGGGALPISPLPAICWGFTGSPPASYSGASAWLGGGTLGNIENDPRGLRWSPEGNILYVSGNTAGTSAPGGGNRVHQINCTTPFSIGGTIGYGGSSPLLAGAASNDGVAFKLDDGLKAYIVDQAGTVFEFALGTPWDVQTMSATPSVTFPIDTGLSGIAFQNPTGIYFKPDGTKFFVVDSNTVISGVPTSRNTVGGFNLSTPWDLSTATWDNTFGELGGGGSPNNIPSSPRDMEMCNTGTKMWVIDSIRIFQFSLETAWDVSSIKYDFIIHDASSEGLLMTGLAWDVQNGARFHLVDDNTQTIYQYNAI